MNLVGIDASGQARTPVYTYANSRPGSADVMRGLRESLERTGSGGAGGLEETRRRTGTPAHVSYAPAQLLQWLTAAATTPERGAGGGEQPQDAGTRRVKVWQTLPSLIAARWCCLASAPVSYSEASWMGLLDLRRLDVRTAKLLWLRGDGPPIIRNGV